MAIGGGVVSLGAIAVSVVIVLMSRGSQGQTLQPDQDASTPEPITTPSRQPGGGTMGRTPTAAPSTSPTISPTSTLPPFTLGWFRPTTAPSLSPSIPPSAQYVTSTIPLTSDQSTTTRFWGYHGATFVPIVNKVFAAPFIRLSGSSTCALLVVDGVSNTASASVPLNQRDGNPWSGMDFAPNVNKLFAAPFEAAAVLVVDPVTNSADTTSLTVDNGNSNGKWRGIAFASIVGKLFAAPFNSASVLIVDPVTNTTDTTTLAGFASGGSKWSGIAFVPTVNKLFAAPYNSNAVLIVDPVSNTTDTTTLGVLGAGLYRWGGIVFVPTVNKLFASPLNADSVLIVDPVTNTTDTTTLSGLGNDNRKWSGIVFVPIINKLFAAPFDADSVLIVDPVANTTDTTTLAGYGSNDDRWGGITFDPVVNKLFATPYSANTVLVVDLGVVTTMAPTTTPTQHPTTPTPTHSPTHSPTTTDSPTQHLTPSPSHEEATSSASTSSASTTEHATRQRVDPSLPPSFGVATRGPESTAGTLTSPHSPSSGSTRPIGTTTSSPSPSSNSSGTPPLGTTSSSSSSSSADSVVYIIVVLLLIIMLVCGVIVWQRRKRRDKSNVRLSQSSGGDGVAKDMAVNPMFYVPSMPTDDDDDAPVPNSATAADYRSPSRRPRPATVFIQQPHSELEQAVTFANDASAVHRPARVAASQTSRPTTIYANPLPIRPAALPAPGEYGELGAPAGASGGAADYESIDNDAPVYAQLDRASSASAVALPSPGEYATINVGAAHTRAKPPPLSIAQDNGGPGVYSHVDRFQPRMMSPRLSAPGPGEVFFAVPLEGSTERVMVLGTKEEGEFC